MYPIDVLSLNKTSSLAQTATAAAFCRLTTDSQIIPLHLVYGTSSTLIFASLIRHSLLHFLLSHMAVHHLHHLHYRHMHLLLLVQYFILNSRLGSSANPSFHRSFPFLPDWFQGLSDHLIILLCSTAGFVCMVCKTKPALSRFSNAL